MTCPRCGLPPKALCVDMPLSRFIVPCQLAALQELPPPDVILLDVQMPEMTGIEALPHIKKLAPATAVLMLSTFFDYTWRQQALAAGARGYYRKDEPAAHLKAAIRAAHINPPPAPVPIPPPVTGFAKLRHLLFGP
jgi:DNA-binding response OmpR family regulator